MVFRNYFDSLSNSTIAKVAYAPKTAANKMQPVQPLYSLYKVQPVLISESSIQNLSAIGNNARNNKIPLNSSHHFTI